MNSLHEILALHTESLGNNYENLGKTVGSCFWKKKKILLSYHEKKGWNVVQLDCISLLLRKLGFFKSTHLKTIVKKWEIVKATTDYANPTLNKKIKALWKKSYPQQDFPSYYVILGNCDPKTAEIKLFCEEHTDQIVRKALGKKINQDYQHGDKILVEVLPAGKISTAEEHRQTQYVKPDYVIQGWEPENIATLEIEMLGEQKIAFNNFFAAMKDCLDFEIKKVNDLAIFIDKIVYFIKLYVESAKYCIKEKIDSITSEKIAKIKNFLQELNTLVAIHQTVDNTDFRVKLFELYFLIEEMKDQLTIAIEKTYMHNLKPENVKKIVEFFKKRNKSLGKEIDLNCKSEHKVFVIAGMAHFLKLSQVKLYTEFPEFYEGVDHLHNVLKNHKFVIYVKREVMEQQEIAKAHPELQIYKKKHG